MAPEISPHILVVDDDTRLRDLLQRFLTDQGFLVSTAHDAADARSKLAGMDFDLLVLDIMMPGENGLALTSSLRESKEVPILLLTAMDEVEDRIAGFETGADDYLTKPFEPRELVLRINAILKRSGVGGDIANGQQIRFGAFVFDLTREELRQGDAFVRLTSVETSLLLALAKTVGEAVSREDLAAASPEIKNSRTIDVQMTRLRRKIEEDPKYPRYLQTVRGTGYVLLLD